MKTREEKIAAGAQLADRMAWFGAEALKRSREFPKTAEGRHVRDQLLRSACAPGAHYAEARGAQSRKDFVYKLSLALKELREAAHWLNVARHCGWLENGGRVLKEADELTRILSASQTTARGA